MEKSPGSREMPVNEARSDDINSTHFGPTPTWEGDLCHMQHELKGPLGKEHRVLRRTCNGNWRTAQVHMPFQCEVVL